MTTSTIVLIVVVVIAAALVIAGFAWVARKKRTEHHRVQAGDIREKAVKQSHEVGQREALADETAAKARAAQAESEAMAARAAALHHQAQARHTDAVTSRSEVNRQFERADKIDPDSDTSDTARDDSETRDTPRGTPAGKQGRPPMPRTG
jgi:FtsZ-interacting cell division protein ZipA